MTPILLNFLFSTSTFDNSDLIISLNKKAKSLLITKYGTFSFGNSENVWSS